MNRGIFFQRDRLDKDMKFREYIVARKATSNSSLLAESIARNPVSGDTTPQPQFGPEVPAKKFGDDQPQVGGPTERREPGELDDQMKRAAALAGELGKLLSRLPHPWNKPFHGFLRPLQAMLAKLHEVT